MDPTIEYQRPNEKRLHSLRESLEKSFACRSSISSNQPAVLVVLVSYVVCLFQDQVYNFCWYRYSKFVSYHLLVIEMVKPSKVQKFRKGLFSISWTVKNLPSYQENAFIRLRKTTCKCSLTCRLENDKVNLEIKTTDPTNSLRGIVITASYFGERREMTFNESTWKAAWECTYFSTSSFEICIDCKPDCVVSVKKRSKACSRAIGKAVSTQDRLRCDFQMWRRNY